MCLYRLAAQVQACSRSAEVTALPAAATHLGLAAAGLVVVAEGLSWTGCLTDYELWNAAEETLWAVAASVLLVGVGMLYVAASTCLHPEAMQSMTGAVAVGTFAYVAFMCKIDIPMYVRKWRDPKAPSRQPTAMRRCRSCRVTRRQSGSRRLRGRDTAPSRQPTATRA